MCIFTYKIKIMKGLLHNASFVTALKDYIKTNVDIDLIFIKFLRSTY